MIESLKQQYNIEQKESRLFKLIIKKEEFLKTLSFISSSSNFITLSQIACADWIEDEIFKLNYILTTKERDKNLMIELEIPREESKLPTLLNFFPQAEVMERDLHEMYGIEFIGNPTLYDFALENWKEIPPMRREFDTLAYVNEHFDFRKGREDNRDVKVEIKRRRAEAKRLKNANK
ncbi:MAG TPA: NADH-quinone oxidoreductase subunit C [Campylobacterales bacterium]|nr:NADH-quinone oxidoreductase subunit C [Campylobacterales bacterium]